MFKIKYFYTLGECNTLANFNYHEHSSVATSDWFTSALSSNNFGYKIVGLNSTRFTDAVIKACLNELATIVVDRHENDYCLESETPVTLPYQTYPFYNKMLNIIELTAPKYIPMLKESEVATENLLKGATSSSHSDTRFNDLAQTNVSGQLDNTHATNSSHSEYGAEMEPESMIDHIKKVFDNFDSVILMWSNEFNKLFFSEAQLDG